VDTSRIAAFSVLADLPAAEVDELAAAMREVEVEAGAKVVTLDDYGTAIYFIEHRERPMSSPTVARRRRLSAPATRSARLHSSLRNSGPATVVARTPMRLLSLSGQDFERIRSRALELERSLRRIGLERARR
jgi:hypothetical protein